MINNMFTDETIIKISNVNIAIVKNAERYLIELICEALKTILVKRYNDLDKLVVDEIFKKETRTFVENMIQERIKLEVDKHIKEMFGK